VLEYDGRFKAVIGYKEAAGSGKAAFKVDRYYQTEWVSEDELPVHLDGLSIDAVYENFVRQIAGDVLQAATPQESLKESVARDDRRDALQKQINKLQAKIRKEKQLNRQMEMNAELKKLRKELEEL
jgi:predicted RNase H-like nuclease (RuvC/YqgF family)